MPKRKFTQKREIKTHAPKHDPISKELKREGE
jgi:hypothetical protein